MISYAVIPKPVPFGKLVVFSDTFIEFENQMCGDMYQDTKIVLEIPMSPALYESVGLNEANFVNGNRYKSYIKFCFYISGNLSATMFLTEKQPTHAKTFKLDISEEDTKILKEVLQKKIKMDTGLSEKEFFRELAMTNFLQDLRFAHFDGKDSEDADLCEKIVDKEFKGADILPSQIYETFNEKLAEGGKETIPLPADFPK